MDRDHIYEVTVVGQDASGADVSQISFELVVTQEDATWRESGEVVAAPTEDPSADTPSGNDRISSTTVDGSVETVGLTYSMTGEDTGVFQIDSTTGVVSYQSWFTPNYAEVWDMDRDHIYEVTVVGQDASGAEVSQISFELVVTQEDATWQVIGSDEADMIYSDLLRVYGNSGNDVIQDGAGVQHLYGGAGSDTFRFVSADNAEDVIEDFEIASDTIDLSAWGVSSPEAVGFSISEAIDDQGISHGIIVSFNEERIRLSNLTANDIINLDESNFIFA